jgi:hypothetical protein
MGEERVELNQENFDVGMRNLHAAQDAIKEIDGKMVTEARVKEAEAKGEKFVKDALAALEPMNRARILGELAGDYSGEGEPLHIRALTDPGPSARALKGQQLNRSEALIAEFNEVCDTMVYGAQRLGLALETYGDDGNPVGAPDVMARNEARYRASMAKSPGGLKLWNRFVSLRTTLAMDTVTELATFVPVGYSPDLVNRYQLEQKVASLFRDIPMPTPVFNMPVMWARGNLLYSMPGQQVATDAPAASASMIPKSDTALQCTLTAKKFHAVQLITDEGIWDSIIPIIPLLRADHVDYLAYCMEQALLNGDTTGTHRDVGTDIGGGTPIATDCRKAWMGLRYAARDASCQTDIHALTPTGIGTVNLRLARTNMGKYGVNPKDCATILPCNAFMKLLSDSNVLTVDKYGPAATLLSGELARVDGQPVIVSEAYPTTDATGIHAAASNVCHSAIMVNHRMFYTGTRLGIESAYTDITRILWGQHAIASWNRRAFCPALALSTTNSCVWYLYYGVA